MKDLLSDVIRHANGLFDPIKVTGTSKSTIFQSVDKDRNLFFSAEAKSPVPEFEGEFGITNLGLLKGLLDLPSYKAPTATFGVKRRPWKDSETVELFEFRDAKGAGADFRCMSADLVPDQAAIGKIPWDLEFQPDPAVHAEFAQLAGLYSRVDALFGTKTKDGKLVFTLGDESSSTHQASMVYAEGITATLKDDLLWNATFFLSVMKMSGESDKIIKITNRAAFGIEFDTPHAVYKYFIRAKTR